MLQPVKIISNTPTTRGKFLNPVTLQYLRNGKKRTWEAIESHASVHVLVDNITTKSLLFVKQVRIPVLNADPSTNGEMVECCAGIIDGYGGTTPKEQAKCIARDEIHEELGYMAPLHEIQTIKELKTSVGVSGSRSYAMFSEVTEENHVGQKLQEDEDIEVISIPYDKVENFLMESTTDAITMYLMTWWVLNKKDK